MADHRVRSQQANHISANTAPGPHLAQVALHRLQGQNFHVAPDDQGIHREGVPELVAGNVVVQDEMQYRRQYPRHIDANNYNHAAYHHHPLPPYRYAAVQHRDVGIADSGAAPAQPLPVVPGQEFQENNGGFYASAPFPAANHPEIVPGVWPHPQANPPADMPPANGLRILAGRFLNNPETLVNMLRIEPGPGGRFEVWIALELADLF